MDNSIQAVVNDALSLSESVLDLVDTDSGSYQRPKVDFRILVRRHGRRVGSKKLRPDSHHDLRSDNEQCGAAHPTSPFGARR